MTQIFLNTLRPMQMVYLATCEGDQPRLRPMTLIHKDGKLYIATGSTDAKSKQAEANPKFEFCLLHQTEQNSGYLRCSGVLRQIDDIPRKKEVADFATYIYHYWQDAANPDYRLYELEVKQVRQMQPGEDLETVTEL